MMIILFRQGISFRLKFPLVRLCYFQVLSQTSLLHVTPSSCTYLGHVWTRRSAAQPPSSNCHQLRDFVAESTVDVVVDLRRHHRRRTRCILATLPSCRRCLGCGSDDDSLHSPRPRCCCRCLSPPSGPLALSPASSSSIMAGS